MAATSQKTQQQKPMGILTGISFQSGIDYYKSINEKFIELVPKHPDHPMPSNPHITLVSVNCAEYAAYLCNKQYDKTREYLWAQGLSILVQNLAPECITDGDVECYEAATTAENKSFFVLASNTAHILLDEDYGGSSFL